MQLENKSDHAAEVVKWWNLGRNADKWDSAHEARGLLGPYLRERTRKVISFLYNQGIGGGHKVLDLGYGAGQSSLALSGLGCAVYGLDIGEGLCERARVRVAAGNPQGEFHLEVGNLETKFPYQDSYFDAVVVIGAMQYLEATDSFLNNVYRVLKPGGVFVVAQRNIYSLSNMTTPRGFLRTAIHFALREPYELQTSFRSMMLDSRLKRLFLPFKDSWLLTNRVVMHRHVEMKYKINKRKNSYFSCRDDLKSKGFELIEFDGAYYPLVENNEMDKINNASHRLINNLARKTGFKWFRFLGRSFVICAKKPIQ